MYDGTLVASIQQNSFGITGLGVEPLFSPVCSSAGIIYKAARSLCLLASAGAPGQVFCFVLSIAHLCPGWAPEAVCILHCALHFILIATGRSRWAATAV